jgi:phenylacetate-CoA ligase
MTPEAHPGLEELRRLHAQRLQQQLERCASNPFQAGLGVHPAEVTPQNLLNTVEALPFTHKRQIAEDQTEHPPFGTNLCHPLRLCTRFSQTSGTSGVPLRRVDTEESWACIARNWMQVLLAADVNPGDRILFAFSFGPFLGFWAAFDAGRMLGAMCIPGGGMSSAGRLASLRENDVTVLCCTPTYALRLGQEARSQSFETASLPLRRIMVAGEPGGGIPQTRSRIESLWPTAQVCDHHGMTEVGPVTHQCPAEPGVLHVMEEAFIAEVLNADNTPTCPGDTGHLVLTTLDPVTSPLIRYRTGDLVQPMPRERCACGRSTLRLRGGILGRMDDMVIVRGVNLHPGGIEEVLHQYQNLHEYRVRVWSERGMSEIEIDVEGDGVVPAEIEERLRAVFHLRIPVRLVPTGTLPRTEMKSKRWVRTDTTERR